MQTYKEVYKFYEDSSHHKEIQEVSELEIKLRGLYKDIGKYLKDDMIQSIDSLIGEISRAYEMQGFSFAQNVFYEKEVDEKQRAEAIRADEERRVKRTNAKGDYGIPVRYVTSNGLKKTISEWLDFLKCASGTFYSHLNRSKQHFDEWVSKRMVLVGVC